MSSKKVDPFKNTTAEKVNPCKKEKEKEARVKRMSVSLNPIKTVFFLDVSPMALE